MVVSAVWAALVLALAVYSARHGEPTVREQTTIAEALPTVDRALADAIGAAQPAGAVAEIGGYREVSARCTLTAARDGARYERAAYLYVPGGQEATLLDRVRAGLPKRYDAQVHNRELTADAGNFVTVRAGIVDGGQVRVRAETGCRPRGDQRAQSLLPGPPAAAKAPVEAVLNTLGVRDVRWGDVRRLPCAGGSMWTVQADGPAGSAPPSLVDALRGASTEPLVARPELYVYRSGPAGIVARTHDRVVTVTATTGCAAQ
jgi:hypothetical protein